MTLANPGTGYARTKKTNEVGIYQFLLVPPGTNYTLTFTKANFQNLTLGPVSLGVGVTETRDVQLKIGDIAERIEVTAQGEATLNTKDASIGNVIDTKRIEDLPSLFRDDATALLSLQPGVQVTGGDSQYGSVTGSRADSGTVTLDGLDVNDEAIGAPFVAVGRASG